MEGSKIVHLTDSLIRYSLYSFRWQTCLICFFFFYSCRRAHSIDVDVSASGFSKDLERDGALLHPVGPEGEEDEENSDEEEADEEEEGEEESVYLDEYRHAMQELEGLKVSSTNADIQEDEEEKSEKKEEETDTAPEARNNEEMEKDKLEELNEAADECPDLEELSAFNKDFKPFR